MSRDHRLRLLAASEVNAERRYARWLSYGSDPLSERRAGTEVPGLDRIDPVPM